jgi:hypothetical protein
MRAVGEGECFRPVTIPKRRQPLGYFVERLVPSEPLPLIYSAFAGALQREIEASGMIEVIDKQPAAGTEPPARNGMLRVAFDPDGAIVFDAQAHTTPRVAETTKRSPSFHHSETSAVSSFPRLAVVYR